jgi:hypothetical protein
MRVSLALFKKEFRQNSLIFGIPFAFLLIVWYYNSLSPDWLPQEWVEIISVAIPVALAGAYGLQAFDLEINSQTRDFLLTRPVGASQIIGAKYLGGLSVLLVFILLWLSVLQPKSIVLPDVFDLESLWLTSFIIFVFTIYDSSFAIGLIVKGPKKLLAALIVGFLCAGWIFWGWTEFVTSLFFIPWFFQHFILATGLVVIFSLATVYGITRFFMEVTRWVLSKLVYEDYFKKLWVCILSFLCLPLLFFGVNRIIQPAIKPFNSMAASFFKLDDWFVAVKGSKQPNGNRFALIDGTGQIGLARAGQKPKIIYAAQAAKPKITALTWSPDGRLLAFSDQGVIKFYELASGKVREVSKGSFSFWSVDNTQLLVGKITDTQPMTLESIEVPSHTIEFSKYDLKSHSVFYWVQFKNMIASSFAWDSPRNQLLALDRSWSLKLISLEQSQVRSIDFLSSLKAYEIILSSQITPSQLKPLLYDIFVYSVDQKTARKNRNLINFRWYTFEPSTEKIILQSTINGLSKQLMDIIPDTDRRLLLVNNGNGVYYTTSLIPGR